MTSRRGDAPGGREWSTPDVAEYERTRYRNLDQRLVAWRERGILSRLLPAAARPGDRVLDVPSGYGRLTGMLAGEGRTIVSADVEPEMLRSARRKATGSATAAPPTAGSVAAPGERAHCCADVRALPFRDGAFDGALCVRLVQHLPDASARADVFGELARVTRRWAVVSAYRKAGLHHLQRRLLGRGRMCVSLDRIRDELVDAGFRVERVARLVPVLHAQTFLLLRRG